MRVSVHIGGRNSHHHKERRVPRNYHRHHRNNYSGGGGVSSPKAGIIIGIVFILFAALFGFLTYNNDMKRKDYIVTSGYVVDYYEKWDSSSGQYLWAEIVEYNVDGKVYEVTSSSSSSSPLPYGSRVNVYYNPVNPGVSVVNQKSNSIIMYVFCGIFGVVGLAVTFFGFKGLISGNE